MRAEQIKNEISKLDVSEKLLLVEEIWDSIASDNSEIAMPNWQKKELNERYNEYKKGKLALHDWEEVHKDLRKK